MFACCSFNRYINNPFMMPPMHHCNCGGNFFAQMLQFSMMQQMLSMFFMPQRQIMPQFAMPMQTTFSYAQPYYNNMTSVFQTPVYQQPTYTTPDYSRLFETTAAPAGTKSYTAVRSGTTANNNKENNRITYNKVANPDKLGPEFLNRIKLMAKNLNCDYRDLLAMINSESSFITTAGYDKKTGEIGCAVGLFQFTEKGAIAQINLDYGKNFTKQDILNMSWQEQCDWAEKLLVNAKNAKFGAGAKLSKADLYALLFAPSLANQNELYKRGTRAYSQNASLDYNGDGVITKDELARRIDKKYVDESMFA